MHARAQFARFTRTASVTDLRPATTTRLHRCERFARKNKTCGRRAVFSVNIPVRSVA